MNSLLHGGVVVPMITPLTPSGQLDETAARGILDRFVAHGLGAFVLGTTGEAASASPALRTRLVELAVEHVRGRVLVYAGIGDNCVEHSVAAGKAYLRLGAHAVVGLLPSYYLLEPPEMQTYFELLARGVEGPLLVYNIPQTTRMSIPVDVLEALAAVPNIVGIKDSENAPDRLENLARRLRDRTNFALFAGVASQAVKAQRLGFHGTVPSSGNLVQAAWKELLEHCQAGRWAQAEARQATLNGVAAVFQANRSLGQSLAALKAALYCRGWCGKDVLPPLQSVSDAELAVIRHQVERIDVR